MSETIIEISLYLILAILLGYIFGWLITKSIYIKKIKSLESENSEKNIKIKTLLEDRERHELEMLAFIEEREEIIKKMQSSKS